MIRYAIKSKISGNYPIGDTCGYGEICDTKFYKTKREALAKRETHEVVVKVMINEVHGKNNG